MGEKEFFKSQFKIEEQNGVYIMIKINLSTLMNKKAIPSLKEIVEKTLISHSTLDELYKREVKFIGMQALDRLCDFFDCKIGDLLQFENGSDHPEQIIGLFKDDAKELDEIVMEAYNQRKNQKPRELEL